MSVKFRAGYQHAKAPNLTVAHRDSVDMVLSAIVGSGACFGLGGPLDVIDLSPRVLGRAGLAGAGGLAVLLLDMILSLSQAMTMMCSPTLFNEVDNLELVNVKESEVT